MSEDRRPWFQGKRGRGRDRQRWTQIDPEKKHEIDEQRGRCVEHTQSRHIKQNWTIHTWNQLKSYVCMRNIHTYIYIYINTLHIRIGVYPHRRWILLKSATLEQASLVICLGTTIFYHQFWWLNPYFEWLKYHLPPFFHGWIIIFHHFSAARTVSGVMNSSRSTMFHGSIMFFHHFSWLNTFFHHFSWLTHHFPQFLHGSDRPEACARGVERSTSKPQAAWVGQIPRAKSQKSMGHHWNIPFSILDMSWHVEHCTYTYNYIHINNYIYILYIRYIGIFLILPVDFERVTLCDFPGLSIWSYCHRGKSASDTVIVCDCHLSFVSCRKLTRPKNAKWWFTVCNSYRFPIFFLSIW